MDDKYVIEMEHITKTFPGIRANDNITLRLKKGEIHALLGENGAGKSTLMSILFGMYAPDSGCIKINGREVKIKDPNDANAYRIGMVHQHFKLVEVFTVLENIILGVEPIKEFHSGKNGFTRGLDKFLTWCNKKIFKVIDKKAAREKVKALSDQYGLTVDLDAKIEDISVGMQQRTEILKMLYRENEILIFDEPTAVLTPNEIEDLLKIMRGLAAEGKSILFISHKLNEIKEVADTCTVLRKGKLVKTLPVKDASKEELSRLMVGRNVSFTVDKAEAKPGEELLRVEHLVVADHIHKGKNAVNDISFNVHRGEIVCIAGIDGNGQSEAVYGITGLDKLKDGKVIFMGQDIGKKSIFKRNNMGLAHIPEDRHKHGLVLDYTLQSNEVLEDYWKPEFAKLGFIKKGAINAYSRKLIQKYDIRSSEGPATIARSMSGGNQQKAIIARELERDPELLVAVQPTRGLDVGAIEYIHKNIVEARDAGKAVLLVSLELDEVLDLSDRILIMFDGQIVGEVNPKTTTPDELSLYMSGVKRDYHFEGEAK